MVIKTNQIKVSNSLLVIPLDGKQAEELKKIQGKTLKIDIGIFRPKRSLSANGLAWILCQKIAESLSYNGITETKENVYRKQIRELFSPSYTFVAENETSVWKAMWQTRGLGWMSEVVNENAPKGFKKMAFWVGSSCFDTKQMSRLIDGLVQEAEQLGIDVMQKAEREALLNRWEKDRGK